MHRLRHVTTKTTKLYVALHEENSSVKRPAYIELNPQRTHAIATIFSLRSGNPQLAAIKSSDITEQMTNAVADKLKTFLISLKNENCMKKSEQSSKINSEAKSCCNYPFWTAAYRAVSTRRS